MLSPFQAYRRLRAFGEGRPLPRGSTLHFPVGGPEAPLIVAFVKMGGESSPWGVAWGSPGGQPQLATTADPRKRDDVADMVMSFAPVLLEHLGHPEFARDAGWSRENPHPLPQLWLPNATHVEMLHFLDFAYTRTRARDEGSRWLLNAAGRACGWLFRESRRPGQVVVMSAADALRTAYTFPAEDARQAHLGYLLAWLETRGDRDARLRRAAEAEQHSMATALDPALERDRLEPLVEAFNEAARAEEGRRQGRAEKEIGAILREELLRRFQLTERAIAWLRADRRPCNRGVLTLANESRREHWYQYLRLEKRIADAEDGPVFTPRPETDHHPAAAGARFFVFESSQAVYDSVLVHDDAELQAEAIAEGRAVRGRIVKVWDEGEGTATVPIWQVESGGRAPARIREGGWLCVAGLPNRTLFVHTIEEVAAGRWQLTLEVRGCKTDRKQPVGVLPAADPRLKGTTVTLLPKVVSEISRRKSQKIWRRDQPGTWLTRGAPSQGIVARDEGLQRELTEVQAALEGVE